MDSINNAKNIENYAKMGVVPLTNEPSQQFQIVLNEQACTLAIYQKDENVFADLWVDEEPIFLGVVCINKVGLKAANYMNFKGQLWFEDTKGSLNPNYKDFGERFVLYYGV